VLVRQTRQERRTRGSGAGGSPVPGRASSRDDP
jgi:hypothetical protein